MRDKETDRPRPSMYVPGEGERKVEEREKERRESEKE